MPVRPISLITLLLAACSTVASGRDDAVGSSSTVDVDGGATHPADDPDDTSSQPFELEHHTRIGDGLILEVNLPWNVDECRELDGAPCEDADSDGLTDAWEDIVLARMQPIRRLDEAELLLSDPAAVVGDVGRVAAVGDAFRVFIMLGYSYDYGSCGVSAHNGDSERVALNLEPVPSLGVGSVAVVEAYTAAHEGEVNDRGHRYGTAELGALTYQDEASTGEPRWVVFPSANKHATYGTVASCEAGALVPCLDEDCAPDNVADLARFDALPEIVNAGEPDSARVDDLGSIGFHGEFAWAEQEFCGGLSRQGCSSPVREKLLSDPFE